jgi:hypothetical protein
MKTFTDAEKQQLQAKIKDEEERQRVLKEIAQIEKEKEAKRRQGIISTVLSHKYGFLAIIICLLIWNVVSLSKWRNFDYDQYGNLMIGLALLFNHIAFHFTKKGRLSRIMKTIAWIWIVFVFAYLFWFFKTGSA